MPVAAGKETADEVRLGEEEIGVSKLHQAVTTLKAKDNVHTAAPTPPPHLGVYDLMLPPNIFLPLLTKFPNESLNRDTYSSYNCNLSLQD